MGTKFRKLKDLKCTDEIAQFAGPASEGLVCSQAGPPREAASPEFTKAFKAKFGDVKQYAPLFYDATNAVIEAMKKADSIDPARFTPEIFRVSFPGATGTVQFDGNGDRKDAEMTIFKMVGGRIKPVATIRSGQLKPF